ncbi:hypothetical protein WA026_017905 [Henosepilachna vigintioctopunctata]|uniref:Uncharacterized protein n=1 Tax=Henosepilachna vigintioctopunctata TaxID=420089 RepID=A0AAW1TWJ1_9CUCU
MKFLIVFALLVIAANASDVSRTYIHDHDGSALINDITPGHFAPDGTPVAPTSATYRTLPFPFFYPNYYRSFWYPQLGY